MFTAQFNLPLLMKWHSRLARIPRWAWIAFFLGALIPRVVIFAAALVAGLLVLAAVLIVGAVLGLVHRLLRPRPRSRGEIVVTGVRVIDLPENIGIGGAAAVATALTQREGRREQPSTTAAQGKGYRVTEHVRSYYRTAKV